MKILLKISLCHPQKKKDEKWIISIHWGDEYIGIQSKNQINLAHQLIDLGFDLIIGHHPHVIQPIETFNEKLILYSLGNFIFDQNFSKRTQKGLVEKILISQDKILSIESLNSYQKKYKITKLKRNKVCIIKKIINKLFIKNNFSYIIRLIYRIYMKLEILIHYSELSSSTRNFYKEKFKK